MSSAGLVLKFPTNREMDVTTQEYQRDASKLAGQKILPMKESMAQKVEWDELDNDTGMTRVHTMDADPKVSSRPGSKLKSYEPIPHKEAEVVKESELLKARAFGSLGGVMDIEQYVMEAFQRGMNKDDIRIEWETWQALQGQLLIEEDGYALTETFPIQEFTPDVEWDELENARPLADIDAAGQLFAGTGASAQGALMWANHFTLTQLFQNQNDADLKGFTNENFRRATYGLEDLNRILAARNYPTWFEYDEGYYHTKTDFRRFIPNGVVIIEGKRPQGQKAGDYCTTPTFHRTRNGQPAPGRFAFIQVNGQPSRTGNQAISLEQLGAHGNPSVAVIHGVYGGPRLKYPRSIIKINAFTED